MTLMRLRILKDLREMQFSCGRNRGSGA